MPTVNYTNAPKEQRKSYSRIQRGAGKGDAPRSCFSLAFRTNLDFISPPKPIPNPFQRYRKVYR